MNQAVPNKTALLALLQANGERIRGFGIRTMGVFGSFKRDEGIHAESDVDFIIEFEEGKHTYRNKMDLYLFLEDLLGREIELIPPAALSPRSGPRILQETEYVTLGPRLILAGKY